MDDQASPTAPVRHKPRVRPTIRHVAAEAGVSIATVSGVLTSRADCRASKETRARVAQVAKRLGYRPSLMAHALHGKKTMTLGLVAGLSSAAEIWGRATGSFEETARGKGYMVLSSYTQNQPELENHVINEMLYRQVDALAIYPTSQGQHERLNEAIDQRLPMVTFDAGWRNLPVHDVSIDQHHGGQLQARHLVAGGCKRICLVNVEPTENVNVLKTQGLIEGLSQSGLKLAGRMDLKHTWTRWSETQPSIYQEIRAFLKNHQGEFDALAAHGDVLALLAMRAAVSLGARVPQDLAVIGFNDIYVAGLMSPSLTTIKDPAEELGKQAAIILMDQLDRDTARPGTSAQPSDSAKLIPQVPTQPLRVKIQPELVIRSSTRAIQV